MYTRLTDYAIKRIEYAEVGRVGRVQGSSGPVVQLGQLLSASVV